MPNQSVLHVVECFGAGTLVALANLCNRLAERGYEVHIAHSVRDETPANYTELFHERITLHRLPMARAVHPVKDLKALFLLKKLIRRIRPDVLHLHSSKAGFLGRAAIALSPLKKRTFYCPHGIAFLRQDISQSQQKIYLGLEWLAARMGGTVVATSQGELDEVRERVRTNRAILIENAIDVEEIHEKSESFINAKDGTQGITIGTIGRIGPQKDPRGFAELVRALQLPEVEWIWIGDGDPDDRSLLESVGVEVTGWLPHDEVLRKLMSFDIYVQNSLWEGMPLSVIEAQVVGIPAVVTDIVGNRDIVRHGQTGYIGKSSDEMLAAIIELASDEELRKQISLQAKNLATRRFHLERYVDEYEAVYQGDKQGE